MALTFSLAMAVEAVASWPILSQFWPTLDYFLPTFCLFFAYFLVLDWKLYNC